MIIITIVIIILIIIIILMHILTIMMMIVVTIVLCPRNPRKYIIKSPVIISVSFRLTKPVSHPPSRGGVPPSAAGLCWIVKKCPRNPRGVDGALPPLARPRGVLYHMIAIIIIIITTVCTIYIYIYICMCMCVYKNTYMYV